MSYGARIVLVFLGVLKLAGKLCDSRNLESLFSVEIVL